MISKREALNLIKRYIKKEENIKASLAAEAIMRRLARLAGEDEDLWGLTGLLHNIDYEYTTDEPQKRGLVAMQILDGLLPEEGVNAIKANNYINTDYLPETRLDKALISTEAVVCLIMETIKTIPTKRILDIDINLLIENYKDSYFALGCNKNKIKLCVHNNMSVEEFLDFSLKVLQEYSQIIGL